MNEITVKTFYHLFVFMLTGKFIGLFCVCILNRSFFDRYLNEVPIWSDKPFKTLLLNFC